MRLWYLCSLFYMKLISRQNQSWLFIPTRDGPWPAVNKGPTNPWPGYFLNRPDEIFLNQSEKNWGFWGEIFQIHKWLTQSEHQTQTTSFGTFRALYTWSAYQPVPMVDHPHYIFIFDLTIHYIKGCRSINTQFSIDSFLDCEDHHWVFIQPQPRFACSLQITALEDFCR